MLPSRILEKAPLPLPRPHYLGDLALPEIISHLQLPCDAILLLYSGSVEGTLWLAARRNCSRVYVRIAVHVVSA